MTDRIRVDISTSPEFTSGPAAKRVKDAGGSYSHCRGHQSKRFVYVPADRLDLVVWLVKTWAPYWRNVTVVMRIEGETSVLKPKTKTDDGILHEYLFTEVERLREIAARKEAARERTRAEQRAARPDVIRERLRALDRERAALEAELAMLTSAA